MSLSLSKKRRLPDLQSEANKKKRSVIPGDAERNLSRRTLDASLDRCGKILRIQLKNFMCHSNLSIDLDRRVNFLIGGNGSGKSAILASVVVGLGSKARNTDRSTSLKQFIKTGKNSAKIEITISNEGPQAYDFETYGKTITVVRVIDKAKTTWYIKAADGRTISSSLKDLMRINLYHNIQVDNPAFVLSQDSAREFLKDMEPKKNYILFLKATQIEMILEKLDGCMHDYKNHVRHLEDLKLKLEKTKKDIGILKEKLNQLVSAKDLKEELKRSETELSWLLVTEFEGQLQEVMQQLEDIENKRSNLLNKTKNKSEMTKDLDKQMSSLENEMTQLNSMYLSKDKSRYESKMKVAKCKGTIADINAYIETFRTKKSFLEKQVAELHLNIQNVSKCNTEAVIAERRQQQEKLKVLNKEIIAIVKTAKNDQKLLVDNNRKLEDKVENLQQDKSHIMSNINRIGMQITSITASSKNTLTLFGENASRLVSLIATAHEEGKFAQLPRGPVGSYLQIPNIRYRDIIEHHLSGILQAFLVNSGEDRRMLEKLVKDNFNNYHPVIITTQFLKKVYDVGKGCVRPVSSTVSLINEIKCSDPVVMNCLIDRAQIEAILITDSIDVGTEITSNAVKVPSNLQKVLVIKPTVEFYPAPKYRIYSLKVQPGRFTQTNPKDQIRQMECQKEKLQQELTSIEKHIVDLKADQNENKRQLTEKRKLIEQEENREFEIREKLRELDELENPSYDETEILKRELAETEANIEKVSTKIDEKIRELAKTKEAVEECQLQFKNVEEEMENIKQQIDKAKMSSEETKSEIFNINSGFARNKTKLIEVEKQYSKLQEEKNAKQKELDDAKKSAEERGERIVTQHRKTKLQSQIRGFQARIKSFSHINEDAEELLALIKNEEDKLKPNEEYFVKIEESVLLLKSALLKRYNFISKLKQHMSLLLQFTFGRILKLRNFIGKIEADHEEKTLKLLVVPRENNSSGDVSNTRSLSGGERSFCTVAFLISLWACVEHPFFFLDEYDVFTDEINREYLRRLLVNEGEQHPSRQFVFSTPQDMSVKSSEFVKIHRLAVADRGEN